MTSEEAMKKAVREGIEAARLDEDISPTQRIARGYEENLRAAEQQKKKAKR